MSFPKLCCFTTLATIVAFAAAGKLNRYTKELDAAKPGTPLIAHALAADGLPWYSVQPASSHWGEMASAVFVPIQSRDAKDLGAGKLLVASRDLTDPNFAKTVILLVHCDDQGVVGLILNRRTNVVLSRVLEGVQGAKDRSDRAYLGGPVDVPAVLALLQSAAKVEGAEHIFSSVYLVSTKALLEQTLAAQPDPQAFHVYLGHAGWTIEQLRMEVQLGSWFIFPGDTDAVFNAEPSSLWPEMIQKTELRFAWSQPRHRLRPD
jgi:putative AlgH/UPF0301 family transcriptional regulator